MDEQSRGYGELRDAVQHVGGQIDALGQKVSRQFVWIVGIQITILVPVVGVLAAALSRG